MPKEFDPWEAAYGAPGKDELTEEELETIKVDNQRTIQSIKNSADAQKAIEEQVTELEDSGLSPTDEELQGGPKAEEKPRDEEASKAKLKQILSQAQKEDPDNLPNIAAAKEEAGIELSPVEKVIHSPIMETLTAPARGLNDTITDALNIIPGVNIPKASRYQSGVANATRDISAVVLPMLMTKRAVTKTGTAIHASKVAPAPIQKLGNDAAFKWFAGMGIDIGSGVAVDAIASQSYTDDNLSGVLKSYWPKTYQWIPNSWATNPDDEPDQKRSKHVNEGAFLGVLSGVIEGAAKLTGAVKSLRKTSEWIPESELAKKNIDALTTDELSLTKFSDNPIEDSVMRNMARQEKELDNVASYFTRNGEELTEPTMGVHDLFDGEEVALRTKDADGVIGASVDAVRVTENIESTYGRLGSIVTEASRKWGLGIDSLQGRALVKGIAEELKSGGKYAKKLASGKVITSKQIAETGERLSALMLDPKMDVAEMKLLLDEFKGEIDGITAVGSEGYRGVVNSLKGYFDQFLDLDVQKARAYLLTSEAGQASDLAEGLRLMDDSAVMARAQDQILDRIEYLMVEKGLAAYQRGAGLAHLRTWKSVKGTKNAKAMKAAADGFSEDVNENLAKIIPNAKNYTNSLRQIAKEKPHWLKPLMFANEMTDGNVTSMFNVHKQASNALGTVDKALIDLNPEIPSIIMQAVWSNIFNSVLSAFATPIKAAVGNFGGLIAEPLSVGYGALREGDSTVMRRAFHQYAGVADTFQKATDHFKILFRKASTDPTSVRFLEREDLALKEANNIEFLRSYAKAAEVDGEYGASALLNIWENQFELAQHPWLRFGINSMTALDGFTRAFFANAAAKGAAFDELFQAGKQLDTAAFRELSEKNYKKMLNSEGVLTEVGEDVAYNTSEVALNLDSNLVQGFNVALKWAPGIRPWFMFPRTSANIIDIFRKYGPGQQFHKFNKTGYNFASDYYDWARKPVEAYSVDEMRELLMKKGIEFNENAITRFKLERAKIKGRAALGNFAVMSAGIAFMQGRLRGTAHWDPQRQRTRREQGWKPKTYKGLDGNWYSYEFLGPLGDWLAMVADIGDNFDNISTAKHEKMLQKAAFILGSAIVNKSVLSNLEPFLEITSGNPAAINKWGATFANSLLPMSGQRSELGRLLTPGLREMDLDFADLARNRNNWIDVFDKEQALPLKYDWVSGKKIGYQENIFVRGWNNYSPIKIHEGQTPEQQFLIDIEYDSRPHFNVSGNGVDLENHERSELYSIVGQDGYFKKELKRIMKRANRLTVEGYDQVGFVDILRAVRRGEISSSVLKTEEFFNVYNQIDKALLRAKRLAEGRISNIKDIRARAIKQQKVTHRTKQGYLEEVLKLANP